MRLTLPIFDEFFGFGSRKAHVNGASARLMLEIQKELSVFQPVEDDETRVLWFEIPRGTADEWKAADYARDIELDEEGMSYQDRLDEFYPSATNWFFLETSTFKGDTFLKISDRYCNCIILTDRKAGRESSSVDLTFLLKLLLDLVRKRVAEIMASPESYFEYVSKFLPPRQRKGRIKSRDLHDIIPETSIQVEDRDKCINVMKDLIVRQGVYESSKGIASTSADYWKENNVPAPFKSMTIRHFCHYYRLADTIFRNGKKGKLIDSDDDVAYYEHCGHSSLEEYDIDSVIDFKRFALDHYGELGLSRMDVGAYPINGDWLVTFRISYSGHLETGLKIAMALYETGAPFIYSDAENTLHALEETGWTRIQPSTFHDYLGHGDDEGAFTLPFVEDCGQDGEITREQFDQIVEKTEWEAIDRLDPDSPVPLSDPAYGLIRGDAEAPVTLSEIRHAIEKKYNTYLSVMYCDKEQAYRFFEPKIMKGNYHSAGLSDQSYASFNEAMHTLIIAFTKEQLEAEESVSCWKDKIGF